MDDNTSNGEKNDVNTINVINTKTEDNEVVSSEKTETSVYIDSSILKFDSNRFKMFSYVLLEKDILYYVVSNKWGLLNTKQEEILPLEYDLISNPGVIKKGIIEVKKNGKYGLINLKGEKLVDVIYDFFLPIEDINYFAIGKIGEEFYLVNDNGRERLNNFEFTPDYYNLNVGELEYLEMIDGGDIDREDEEEQLGNRIFITPSYISVLNVMPDITRNLAVSKYKALSLGVSEMRFTVQKEYSFMDRVKLFATKFYEEGVDGRGWANEQNNLIVLDKKTGSVDQLPLQSNSYESFFCEVEIPKESKVSIFDSIIEVKLCDDQENIISTTCKRCDRYEYYSLDEKQSFRKLETVREYNFTKYRKINSEVLSGTFLLENNDGYGYKNHYSKDELDVMRNEIFAEYGYKFKTEKWNVYFSNFYWYKPKYENVDPLLNDIDRHNINILLNEYERLDKYITEFEKVECGYAG